jgi:RNA polymerase subunit RPABC4/transcription elongation factor Spt4
MGAGPYYRAWRRRRIAMGLCTHCQDMAAQWSAKCAACGAKHRERERVRNTAKRKAAYRAPEVVMLPCMRNCGRSISGLVKRQRICPACRLKRRRERWQERHIDAKFAEAMRAIRARRATQKAA